MEFDSTSNDEKYVEKGRKKGQWRDHTTFENRYHGFEEELGEYIQEDDDIMMLDAGCSSGLATETHAEYLEEEYGVNVEVIGLDLSDEKLKEAESKKRIDYPVQGSLTDIPLENDSVDYFLTKTTVSRMPGEAQTQALQEALRVTKPEGFVSLEVDPKGKDRTYSGIHYVGSTQELQEMADETSEFEDYPLPIESEIQTSENIEENLIRQENAFESIASDLEEIEEDNENDDDIIIG